jgi:sedoheptulokinase
MHFIGIDVGTSTICGVVYDLENKKIHSLSKENNSYLLTLNDWEKIQSPQKILSIVEEILEEFLNEFNDIKGIGITGQMHGILYIDKYGKSLSPLFTWQDGRGNLIFHDNLSYSTYINQITGYSVASGFGLVTHFYNLKNNLVPDNAYKICTIMDYIVTQLTGEKEIAIDVSNAASLGFFDLVNMSFDSETIRNVSIDPAILPKVSSSLTVAGLYNKSIPVYTTIGDNQASILGSISELKKSILVNIGTSGQISVYSDKFVQVDTLDTRPFPGGGYILVGASLCGGISLNILKNLFEKIIEMYNRVKLSEYDFYKISDSIDFTSLDFNDPLKIDTLFNGTREKPNLRGSIRNISTVNFTPQNLILGTYHGICNELYDFFKIIPDRIKSETTLLVGSGNAIRKNSLLRKVLENRFGSSLIIPKNDEEAAFGASLCSIVGGKYINSFMEAGKEIEYIHDDYPD